MRRTLKPLVMALLVILFTYSCNESDDGGTQIANSPILGIWNVASVKVSEATLVQNSPSDETITITFEEGGTYTGSTPANTFDGRFELEGTSTLTWLEFTSTEVADTAFAGIFFEAVTAAIVPDSTFAQFRYSFDGQNMILDFGDDGQMILTRQ